MVLFSTYSVVRIVEDVELPGIQQLLHYGYGMMINVGWKGIPLSLSSGNSSVMGGNTEVPLIWVFTSEIEPGIRL